METLGVRGDLDVEVGGVRADSRRVGPGDLFVALRGEHSDGRRFVGEAASRGAVAVLTDGAEDVLSPVTAVRVSDARVALARVSSEFYGHPSERLSLTGVTGTNGKTSVTYILKSVLAAAGLRAGLIGTIGHDSGHGMRPSDFTTPEAPLFQAMLAEMVAGGMGYAVAEVSSHALAMRRVDACRFGVAVFTNLTREHLDFHHTMQEYFEAKKRLFTELLAPGGIAVLNADDPWAMKLGDSLKKNTVITCGLGQGADLRAVGVRAGGRGLSFGIEHMGETHGISSALIGRPNVSNIILAAGAALALGVGWDAIAEGVGSMGGVVGRFQTVREGQDFLLIIDYAHTDDALRGLLQSVREITTGRLITVFGCGGERDRGKRPAMGQAATELSDVVIITSDNPRGEAPDAIISEILAGAARDNYRVEPDRARAIRMAVAEARGADTVVIAGKGHEDYQIVKGQRLRFSDLDAARDAIRGLSG